MLKNEVRTISRTISKDTAFTLLGTPTLVVYRPDNTVDNPTVSVDPAAATPATSRTMFATLSFPQGGTYYANWAFGEGVQTSVILTDIYFAFHTYIYEQVRNEMKLSESALPDEVIDLLASRILQGMSASFPTLRAYDMFVTPQEVSTIDEVLVYLICIKLRKMGYMGPPSGELISWQFQQTKFQFSPVQASSSSVSREDQLLASAMQVFQRIAEIATLMVERRGRFLGFHVSGPSRVRTENTGGRQSLYGTVASLLTDAINFGAC